MRVFSIQKSLSITVVFLLVLSLVFAFAASCSQDPSTTTPAPTTTPPATTPVPPATTPVPTTTPPPTTTPAEPDDGLPLVNFNTPNFAGSSNCAACHRNLIDQSGKDVSMDHQWRSTMMANAARDPYFTAKVSAEIKNAPHLQQVIEDTCSTCHTPMARTEEVAQGNQGLLFGSGFLNPANSLHQAGIDGVSCTVCHQIQPEGLGQEATFGGQYIIDTLTPRPERVIFSQFPDPSQQIMAVSSGFKPVYGEHLGESVLCATCHTVITPYLDAQGEVQGTFFEQAPFLEWAHSRYYDDISCQVCHMPAAAGNTKTASMPANMEPKYPFSQHIFVGGNVQMLEILRDNPDELGVTASTEHFNASIERALDQLENRTGQIWVSDSGVSGDTVSATVTVANYTGHKLPTAFPSRRMWIHFQLLDKDGKIVFESGKPNADGSITGNRADSEIYAYEPHYDVITSEDQVQIYEAILQTMEGDITHTLLRAATYAKDNRVLPEGFDKNNTENSFAVFGAALADDNFTGGSDQVTYQINTSGFTGPFTVKIDLLYQSLAYSSIHALFETDTPEVQEFKAFFDASDKTPKLICTFTEEIA